MEIEFSKDGKGKVLIGIGCKNYCQYRNFAL